MYLTINFSYLNLSRRCKDAISTLSSHLLTRNNLMLLLIRILKTQPLTAIRLCLSGLELKLLKLITCHVRLQISAAIRYHRHQQVSRQATNQSATFKPQINQIKKCQQQGRILPGSTKIKPHAKQLLYEFLTCLSCGLIIVSHTYVT